MWLFRRPTLPTTSTGLQPSAPTTTESAPSRSAAPDSLAGSNSREHERLFSAFLHEIGAGERKRKTEFLSFCRSVEEAFDVAQAERRAQLRSIDHSIRAEAKEVHDSLLERAAAAETERDRLSAHCLSPSSAVGLQLAQIRDRYAAIMDRLQCRIDMAQTMGIPTTEFADSVLTLPGLRIDRHYFDFDEPLDPHVEGSINVVTTERNSYPEAGDSGLLHGASATDLHLRLAPETDILTRLLDGLAVPAAGLGSTFMRDIWLRRQRELDRDSWNTLTDWDRDFDALQSDLQSKFLTVLPPGSAICADLTPDTLMIIALRYRIANTRRAARIQDAWATRLQELNGLVDRHIIATRNLKASRSLPRLSMRSPSIGQGHPRDIFLHRFPIRAQLPVLPRKPQIRKEVDLEDPDAFQRTLSALRVDSDSRESGRQEDYEFAALQWRSRAAQAERRRQLLFNDAIDRFRAVAQRQISDLSVAGEQLALDLEVASIAAQSSREDAMRLALQSLDQQLQDAAEEALRSIEAAIKDMTQRRGISEACWIVAEW